MNGYMTFKSPLKVMNGYMTAKTPVKVMNGLVVVFILLSSAQENHGLENLHKINRNQLNNNNMSASVINHSRTKRYAPHLNPLYRNFDFFNNDGNDFVDYCGLSVNVFTNIALAFGGYGNELFMYNFFK